jgi:DNA-directed RNA polymerase subunit RPC12/RpoP
MIEMSKFRMHDVGCARMNYKCKVCGEVVLKAEKDEHEAKAHAKVQCQYCQYSEIASKFGTHEERCELRPKPCQYCTKLFSFEKLLDHVD